MGRVGFVALAATLGAVGCYDAPYLVVHVAAASSTARAVRLHLVTKIGGRAGSVVDAPATPSALSFPLTLALKLPAGTRDEVEVDATAMDAAASALLSGSGATRVSGDGSYSISITLAGVGPTGADLGGGGAGDLGGGTVDLAGLVDLAAAAPADLAVAPVSLRSIASAYTASQTLPKSITVSRPAGVVAGDFLLAEIALGENSNTVPPKIVAPSGWTLHDRLDAGSALFLAIYTHVASASEPTAYTFSADEQAEGVAWIGAFTNTAGIDVSAGLVVNTSATIYTTPTVTTKTPGSLLVATFTAHGSSPPTWTVPAGLTQILNLNNQDARGSFAGTAPMATPGLAGPYHSTASSTQDYGVTYLLALRP